MTKAADCPILLEEIKSKEGHGMEGCCVLRIGKKVPEFTLETFEPEAGGFGEIGSEELKRHGKWTILFFYPADFTFV